MSNSSPASNLTSDVTFSMMAKVLYLITRLGLPPMILAHVTLAEYGLWSACFILIGYIGMADLGLATAYVRGASRMHASNDIAGIGSMLSTGMTLMAGVALVLLTLIVVTLPNLMNLLKIDSAGRATATLLIIGTAAIFLVDMSVSAFAYVLHGLQQYRAEQRNWVAAFMLELVLIIAFLLGGMGIFSLMAAFMLRLGYSMVANMRVAYRVLPGLSVSLRQFDRRLLRGFLGSGMVMQANSLMAIGLQSVDKLAAGIILGPASIALFDIGAKLPAAAISIPSAISQLAMPAAARLPPAERSFRQDWQQDPLAQLYVKTSRSCMLMASLMNSFLAAFSIPLCVAWLGQRAGFDVLPLLMTLTACSTALHVSTGPGSAVFRGCGRLGNEFVYHGLRMLLSALALGTLYYFMAASVAMLAIALSLALAVAAVLYMAHNHRALGLPLTHLLTRILLPGLLPFGIGALLYLAWRLIVPADTGRWPTLALLALFGALHLGLCGLAIWRLLDGDERGKLEALATRILARFERVQPSWMSR